MSCGFAPVRSRTALTRRSGTCGLIRLLATTDVTAIGIVLRLVKLGVLVSVTRLSSRLAYEAEKLSPARRRSTMRAVPPTRRSMSRSSAAKRFGCRYEFLSVTSLEPLGAEIAPGEPDA